jgi:hypothetical protein
MSNEAKWPSHHASGGGTTNHDWWPNRLKVELLRFFDIGLRVQVGPSISRPSSKTSCTAMSKGFVSSHAAGNIEIETTLLPPLVF